MSQNSFLRKLNFNILVHRWRKQRAINFLYRPYTVFHQRALHNESFILLVSYLFSTLKGKKKILTRLFSFLVHHTNDNPANENKNGTSKIIRKIRLES